MKTRLQEWRERRFLSIRKLGELAGVKPNTISDIEKGLRRPRLDTMQRLANALGISVDDLAEIKSHVAA